MLPCDRDSFSASSVPLLAPKPQGLTWDPGDTTRQAGSLAEVTQDVCAFFKRLSELNKLANEQRKLIAVLKCDHSFACPVCQAALLQPLLPAATPPPRIWEVRGRCLELSTDHGWEGVSPGQCIWLRVSHGCGGGRQGRALLLASWTWDQVLGGGGRPCPEHQRGPAFAMTMDKVPRASSERTEELVEGQCIAFWIRLVLCSPWALGSFTHYAWIFPAHGLACWDLPLSLHTPCHTLARVRSWHMGQAGPSVLDGLRHQPATLGHPTFLLNAGQAVSKLGGWRPSPETCLLTAPRAGYRWVFSPEC